MSFRCVIGMAVLLGAGWAQAADKPVVGDATAGAAKVAICAACHGADGNPASSQYPKLAGQNENYIARQIELMKTGKRQNPVMVAFVASLSEQDMHDIGAFYASKTVLAGAASAKPAEQGQSYYRGGDAQDRVPACMACHSPDGHGNPGAMYPHLAGQFADYTTAKLKAFRDGQGFSTDDRGKIMTAVAKPLTDADIAALAGYIEGLDTATPKTAEPAK
jgi:cytochrome c553